MGDLANLELTIIDEVIVCGYPSIRVPGARDDQRSPKINKFGWMDWEI